MSAERLRDISAGAQLGEGEEAKIEFALVASALSDQDRQELIDRREQQTRRLLRLSLAAWLVALVLLAVTLAITAQHEIHEVLPTLLTPAAQ